MVFGYNVQVAGDGRHGLIAHHAVTQDASDQNQLAPVALEARAALGAEALEVVADAGYGDAAQVKACDEAGVTTYVPHPRAVNTRGAFFDKSRFAYDAERDSYRCPAGRRLRFRNVPGQDRPRNRRAAADCTDCPLKRHCTDAKDRKRTRLNSSH